MRKSLSLVGLAILLPSAGVIAADESAKDVLAKIDKQGAQVVLQQWTSEFGWPELNRVLAKASTGDSEWLSVVAKLDDAAIGNESSNGHNPILAIDAAVAIALPKAPRVVLRSFDINSVCSPFFHNATKAEYLDWIDRTSAALEKMPPDSLLDGAKRDCLAALNKKLTEVKKLPDDPPQEILQPVMQLVDLLSDGSAEFYPQGLQYLAYGGGDSSSRWEGRETDHGFVAAFGLEGWGGSNASSDYLAYFAPAYSGGYWNKKKYMLQNYLVVGGRGWRFMKLVRIDKDTVILEGKKYGPGDGACCPSVPIQVRIKIGRSGLEYTNKDDAE